jgi:hypothetical protein
MAVLLTSHSCSVRVGVILQPQITFNLSDILRFFFSLRITKGNVRDFEGRGGRGEKTKKTSGNKANQRKETTFYLKIYSELFYRSQ